MDRQKLLLIFGGAWVSAALLTWFLYATTQAPHAEKTVACAVAARDLPAGQLLRKADIKVIQVPQRALAKNAVLTEQGALDRVLLFPVSANEAFTDAKLTQATKAEGLAATIEHGKRAVSVPITDASSAAGLIQPRSHVDVLFTRTGSVAEAVTSTILENVVVMSIGRVTEVSQNPTDLKAARPASTTATLIVTPEQARKLELAKNEGKISLSLRNPLDHEGALDTSPTTASALNIGAIEKKKPYSGPDMRDPRAWQRLVGPPEKKEPPKPRLVVDVYRGDKHVQEIFQ